MNEHMRLTSTGGTEYVARLVYPSDRYGDGQRLVNTSYRVLVEFIATSSFGEQSIAAFAVDDLPVSGPGWSPNGDPRFALPKGELDRMQAWLADPTAAAVDEAALLMVGDDDDLAKAAVALRALGLALHRTADAGRAFQQAKTLGPQLVVVGSHTTSLEPLEFVRRLREAPETCDVPVLVIGGDATAAGAAGAALHFPSPPDYTKLTAGAAELLDFV